MRWHSGVPLSKNPLSVGIPTHMHMAPQVAALCVCSGSGIRGFQWPTATGFIRVRAYRRTLCRNPIRLTTIHLFIPTLFARSLTNSVRRARHRSRPASKRSVTFLGGMRKPAIGSAWLVWRNWVDFSRPSHPCLIDHKACALGNVPIGTRGLR